MPIPNIPTIEYRHIIFDDLDYYPYLKKYTNKPHSDEINKLIKLCFNRKIWC